MTDNDQQNTIVSDYDKSNKYAADATSGMYQFSDFDEGQAAGKSELSG